MPPKGTIAGFVLLFIVICGLVYLAWATWTDLEENGYLSCIGSVMSTLNRQIETKELEITPYDLPEDGSWKVLKETDAKNLLASTVGGDCARTKDNTLDPWGRPVNVAMRISNEPLRAVIWSNGRDGKSGTADDLSAPYGMRYIDGKVRSDF